MRLIFQLALFHHCISFYFSLQLHVDISKRIFSFILQYSLYIYFLLLQRYYFIRLMCYYCLLCLFMELSTSVKVVILAGGLGSRLSEETHLKPKPMVEIGGMPIIWHIMKIFASQGFTDFIVCCGYKGYVIKEFFSNYFLHASDVTFDYHLRTTYYHDEPREAWSVTLVDTGENTLTGGRLKKVSKYLHGSKFFLTYGDGLADVDLRALYDSHVLSNKIATVTAVTNPGRFGILKLDLDVTKDSSVLDFTEKPLQQDSFINGGFFLLDPSVLDYLPHYDSMWEEQPLKKLVNERQLNAYVHHGFWQPMDTLREKQLLEQLWSSGKAPWKIW